MKTAAMAARSGSPIRRLLALLLLMALPLLAFEIVSIVQLRQAREEEIRQDASRVLDLVEAEQKRIVDGIHNVLIALTETGLGQMDPATCRQTLERIKDRYPNYLAINAAGKDGVVWCSTVPSAIGLSVAGRTYRQDALKTDDVVTGQFIMSVTTGRPAIPIARSYRGADGQRDGSVVVLLDTTWLEHYLVEKSLPQDASILIADSGGTVLARVPEIPGLVGHPMPARYRFMLDSTNKGVVDILDLDGVQRITAYSPLVAGVRNLYIQVSIDKAKALRAVDVAVLRSLLIFTVLLLITGLGAAWGIRRFIRVREEAQQSALKTAAVLASTVDGVIELDRGWRFTYLNDKAKDLIAQGRDLLGQSLWEAFPELVDSPLWDKAHEAMAKQTPTDAEFQGARTGRWFWMRAFPSPDGLSVYLLDITRRRKAEEELRDSQNHLNLALESAQAGTFDWDLRTGQGFWSEEGFRIFGLDPDKDVANTDTWRRILHPDDRDTAQVISQTQLLEEQKPYFRLEYRIILPNGGLRWITSIGRVHYGANGRPLRISGLNIDVTERRVMEETLRRTEERLTIALAAAEAGIWDYDAYNGALTWSDGMFSLYGVEQGSFVPSADAFYELVHPDDREAVRTFTREVLETKRPDYRVEFRINNPKLGLRWIMAIGRPIYDAGGRPVRLGGLNIDITARKGMEQALRDAKAKADEANVSKSKFLAAASHDLRQPLQSALLFAGVLHRYVGDERGRGPLLSLERALDTLKNLLDSLLDVSRLDAGVIVPQFADLPLGPLLDEIQAAYAPIAASKGLEFGVEQPCAPLAVRSDRLLLGRMLRNLVENAIRYTEQGHVCIDCVPTPDGVSIRVRDSGIGISAEHLAKVFEEFHQVGNPERDRSQGLGLGLAIVQRLSRLLHHPVHVRSEPGQGSTFSIEVPAAAEPLAELPAVPEPVNDTPGRDRLAVLVDDDTIVLTGLRTVFREWGYDVVIAGSAEQALERLNIVARVPDIIIADYRLRERKVGTDAIVRIREQVGHMVPGVILTGEIGPECDRDAEIHGLTVVHKPVTPRQLLAVVQRLLEPAAEAQAGGHGA